MEDPAFTRDILPLLTRSAGYDSPDATDDAGEFGYGAFDAVQRRAGVQKHGVSREGHLAKQRVRHVPEILGHFPFFCLDQTPKHLGPIPRTLSRGLRPTSSLESLGFALNICDTHVLVLPTQIR
jgi:hypothetical protein